MSGTDGTAVNAQQQQMMDVLSGMAQLLQNLNDNGVQASMDMYGRHGALEKIKKAERFVKRH